MVRYKTTAETQKKKELVALSNCEIKPSKWGSQLEVLMRKKLQKSPKKFIVASLVCHTSNEITFNQLQDFTTDVCTFDTIRQLGQNHQSSELTHIPFHMVVSPEYETYRMKITSEYVRQCVYTTIEIRSKEDCVQFLRSLVRSNFLAVVHGKLLELKAHEILL